jgi:hypothetical protein
MTHHQSGQEGKPVVLDRLRQQHVYQLSRSAFPEGAQPELLLALDRASLPVSLGSEIFVDAVRKNIDLRRDEGQRGRRRTLASTQCAPRETQVAEHQRIAEAVVVAAAATDRGKISFGQRVVAYKLTLFRRWLE